MSAFTLAPRLFPRIGVSNTGNTADGVRSGIDCEPLLRPTGVIDDDPGRLLMPLPLPSPAAAAVVVVGKAADDLFLPLEIFTRSGVEKYSESFIGGITITSSSPAQSCSFGFPETLGFVTGLDVLERDELDIYRLSAGFSLSLSWLTGAALGTGLPLPRDSLPRLARGGLRPSITSRDTSDRNMSSAGPPSSGPLLVRATTTTSESDLSGCNCCIVGAVSVASDEVNGGPTAEATTAEAMTPCRAPAPSAMRDNASSTPEQAGAAESIKSST